LDYSRALKWLYERIGEGIKLGLGNTRKFLEILGNPHHNYKNILIGGTNGKGSVCSYIAHIVSLCGAKVGLFTSPHLVTVRERMAIIEKGRKRLIPPPVFAHLMGKLKEIVESIPEFRPTYFETLTTASLLYFSWEKVDLAVLEVGMGGRLDATNVVDPILSVITNVSFDHTQYLGDSIPKIAREKAGIIRKGTPIITGCEGEAVKVIRESAKEKNAPLYILGEDIEVKKFEKRDGEISIHMKGLKGSYSLTTILWGDYQVHNLPLAVASCELLMEFFPLTPQDIVEGVRITRWPGRMEVLRRRPTIILDGAHNPGGALYLKREILRWKEEGKKITLIFGVLKDKERDKIMRELFPVVDEVRVTAPQSSRAVSPQTLFEEGKRYNPNVKLFPSVPEALLNLPKKNIILVSGSLYLVGEVRGKMLKLKGDGYEGV